MSFAQPPDRAAAAPLDPVLLEQREISHTQDDLGAAAAQFVKRGSCSRRGNELLRRFLRDQLQAHLHPRGQPNPASAHPLRGSANLPSTSCAGVCRRSLRPLDVCTAASREAGSLVGQHADHDTVRIANEEATDALGLVDRAVDHFVPGPRR